MKLVSVVMPVYNCASYVGEALNSVLKQTHSNLEILICDDSSTDGTLDVVKTFTDKRITILESPVNQGQAHQLNKGIKVSRGDYVAIMHGDDLCYANRIEEQVNYLEKNPAVDICGCWIDFAGEWKKYKYPAGVYEYYADDTLLKLNLLEGVPFAHPSVFLRRSLIETGRFVYDQQYVPAEDWELWVRIAPYVRFGNVEKALVTYRIHDHQISVTASRRFDACVKHIRQQCFKLLYNFSDDESERLEEFIYNKEDPPTNEKLHLLYSFLERSINGNRRKSESYSLQKVVLNQTVVRKIEALPWNLAIQFVLNSNVQKALGMKSAGGIIKRKLLRQ